ncbi:MAG TPA: M50 family metallopeptidase, partial [Anaerolineaceae bacterium]
MKWSLLVGKFWGAEIRLHISLLLLIPYAFFAFKPESLNGLLRVLALLVGIFACVALHEMGHTLAARLFGIQASSIVLWPLGGYTSLSRRPEKLIAELVISAAGPLANLILFAGLALVTGIERILEDSQAFPTLSRLLWQSDLFAFLATLAVANLALALFNLAPVYPLDGGQIARGVLKGIFGERHADLVMLVVSLPLALVITGIGLALGDLGVILTGLILLLASATLNQNLANWLSLGVLYLFDRPEYYLKNQDYDRAVSA